jgi:hypothetical protein
VSSILDSTFVAIVAGATGALSALGVASAQRRLTRRVDQNDAKAALRYEAESNLTWSARLSTDEPGPYLRDEAQVAMKNRGWLGYLDEPLRRTIIESYNALYRLNDLTRRLREPSRTDQRPNDTVEDYREAIDAFQTTTRAMLLDLGPSAD